MYTRTLPFMQNQTYGQAHARAIRQLMSPRTRGRRAPLRVQVPATRAEAQDGSAGVAEPGAAGFVAGQQGGGAVFEVPASACCVLRAACYVQPVDTKHLGQERLRAVGSADRLLKRDTSPLASHWCFGGMAWCTSGPSAPCGGVLCCAVLPDVCPRSRPAAPPQLPVPGGQQAGGGVVHAQMRAHVHSWRGRWAKAVLGHPGSA